MKKLTEADKAEFKRLKDGVRPEDEAKVRQAFAEAEKKAKARGADWDLLQGVKTLWKMLTDPDYVVRWETKGWIIFALLYFICPADIIPDAIPVAGYLDDALVVAWVLHLISEEVATYRKLRQ